MCSPPSSPLSTSSISAQVSGHPQPANFAFAAVWRYLAPVNKYSPLISEFGSAEEEAAYLEWLKKTVAESLADGKPLVPHDEATARIDAILEQAKARQKRC
jgi:hypothetical protein